MEGIALKELFARLPNVIHAIATFAMPSTGKVANQPIWKRLRDRILVSPDDWIHDKAYSDTEKGICLSGCSTLSFLEAVEFRSSFAGTKPLETVTIHSAHAGAYGDVVRTSLNLGNAPLILQSVHKWDAQLTKIAMGFRQLRYLHLRVQHLSLEHETGMELIALLTAAKELRSLQLEYSEHGDDGVKTVLAQDSLMTVFESDRPWPHLQHLGLSINMLGSVLSPLLDNLALTLRSLELRNMLVYGVTAVIGQIPETLSLERVYLECIWDERARYIDRHSEEVVEYDCVFPYGTNIDDPFERSIKAYLLRQSSELPELNVGPARRASTHDEDTLEILQGIEGLFTADHARDYP